MAEGHLDGCCAGTLHFGYAQVYAFLGSLFDPACESFDHERALGQMQPVEQEISLLLLNNLARNLRTSSGALRTVLSGVQLGLSNNTTVCMEAGRQQ